MLDERDATSRLSRLRALATPDQLGRDLPAGRVLEARVREQLEALLEAELTIRAGDASGVHEARVACRRLRAALATFRPALRVDVSEPLRDELRWLAGSLGATRDQDVVRERLLTLAREEGVNARALIEGIRAEDWSPRDDTPVLAALDSKRYVDLLDSLDNFVADPPLSPAAESAAGSFLRRRIRIEWRRLEDRVLPVADLEAGTAPDQGLHEARKAAKRLRYALEVAELLWRKKAKRLRKQVHTLTDILGERQDTVVTRAVLLELAAQSEAAGDPTFAHVRLHRIEESRAAELEAQFKSEWSATLERRRSWP
jgi:CHAD domain-containing protein